MALTKISTAMWNAVPHHLSHDFNVDDVLFVDVSENKVGIGTISPSNTLHIYKNATIGAITSTTTANAGLRIQDSGANMYFDGNSIILDNTGYLTTNGAHNFVLGTNNTARIHIDSGGNIGIGTTSPSYKLDVRDNVNAALRINAKNNFSGANATAEIWASANGNNFRIVNYPDADTTNANRTDFISSAGSSYFTFSAASTERMRIDSGGDISFRDTSNNEAFYWDASAARLGIGTTSPTRELEVEGAGNVYIRVNAKTDNDSTAIELVNTQETWTIRNDDTNNDAFEIDSSTTGNIVTIEKTGSVGIGTTSPSGKLHVHHNSEEVIRVDSGTTGAIHFFESGSRRGIIGYSNGTSIASAADAGDMVLRAENGKKLHLGVGGQVAMTINDSERIGIGTTSPNVKLAIQGQSSTGDRKLSLGILDINSSGTPTQVKIVTNIPYASGSADFTVNIKGFIYGSAIATDLSVHWHYYANTFYNATATSKGSWAPTITLGVENGKVVIHLSSPGYWPKFYVESMYSSAYTDQYAAGWSWTDAAISSDTGTPKVTAPYKSNFGNSFVMNSSGNVGIGITSPSTPLHVHQAADAPVLLTLHNSRSDIVPNNTQGNFIDFKMTDGNATFTPQARIGMIVNDSDGDGGIISEGTGNFVIYTGEGTNSSGSGTLTEHFRVNDKGNVGIGTNTPSDGDLTINTPKLHVVGPSTSGSYNLAARFQAGGDSDNTGAAILINHSNDRGLLIKAGRKDSDREVAYFDVISSGGNATNMLTMGKYGSSYNVGIGTTSPSNKLHVVTSDNEGIYMQGTGSGHWFNFKSATSNLWSMGAWSGRMGWYNRTNSSYRMVITDGGNVGIGTTAPSAKLHIIGDTGLKVFTSTNGVGAKINFSDHAGGSYTQNGTMEYVHADGSSFGSGNAFKFYGTESSLSFHVAGKGLFTGDVTAYYSDMRLKTKIGDIEKPLDKINQLNGFYYEPNEIAISHGYTKEKRIGLSAQEVEKVLPEAISNAAIGEGYKAVNYEKLVPLLIEAVKELSEKVKILENK